MQCSKCGTAITIENSFEVSSKRLCLQCFLALAQSAKPLTGDERKRLKKAVQEELAGLLPREALREAIEDGYASILKGEDFDENVSRLVNQIERIAGLGMCNEILLVIMALKKTLEEQEDEIRSKIRRLGELQ